MMTCGPSVGSVASCRSITRARPRRFVLDDGPSDQSTWPASVSRSAIAPPLAVGRLGPRVAHGQHEAADGPWRVRLVFDVAHVTLPAIRSSGFLGEVARRPDGPARSRAAEAPRARRCPPPCNSGDETGSRRADWRGSARPLAARCACASDPVRAPEWPTAATRCTDAVDWIELHAVGDLDDLAEVHHRHAIADVLDHGEIVSDEDVGQPQRRWRSRSRLTICAWIDTSSAETGSSATISFGLTARARATPMRCRWPPENSCG